MSKKKQAIGYFISAAVFIVVGVVTWILPEIPSVIPVVLNGVGAICGALGISISLPKWK